MTALAPGCRALHAQPDAPGDRADAAGATIMPDDRGRMTPDELRDALASVGLSLAGFAKFLVEMGDAAGDKERTVQRWATGQQDVPGPILVVLKLLALTMAVTEYSADEVAALAKDALDPDEDDGEAEIVEDRRTK